MIELIALLWLAIYLVLCFVVCPRLSEIVAYLKKIYAYIKEE